VKWPLYDWRARKKNGEQAQNRVRELIDQPKPVFEIVKKVLEK
jgi:hypothetical protein